MTIHRLFHICLTLSFFLCFSGALRAEPANAADIKAVYIYNFINFVHWPERAHHTSQQTFSVCSYGSGEISLRLSEILKGEKIHNQQILYKNIKELDEITECQLIFVEASAARSWLRNIDITNLYGKLIVTDDDEVSTRNGMISFENNSRRIKPVIFRERILNAGMEVSSKLLRISNIAAGR